MSYENRSYTATGDVNPSRFVALVKPYTVRQALAADEVIGISGTFTRRFDDTTHADDGESVRVFGPGEEALLELGSGGATAGDYLSPDSSGKGVIVTNGAADGVGAVALTDGSAGEFIPVKVGTFSAQIV